MNNRQNQFAALDSVSRRAIPMRYAAPRILATATMPTQSAAIGQVSSDLEFESTNSLQELFPDFVAPEE